MSVELKSIFAAPLSPQGPPFKRSFQEEKAGDLACSFATPLRLESYDYAFDGALCRAWSGEMPLLWFSPAGYRRPASLGGGAGWIAMRRSQLFYQEVESTFLSGRFYRAASLRYLELSAHCGLRDGDVLLWRPGSLWLRRLDQTTCVEVSTNFGKGKAIPQRNWRTQNTQFLRQALQQEEALRALQNADAWLSQEEDARFWNAVECERFDALTLRAALQGLRALQDVGACDFISSQRRAWCVRGFPANQTKGKRDLLACRPYLGKGVDPPRYAPCWPPDERVWSDIVSVLLQECGARFCPERFFGAVAGSNGLLTREMFPVWVPRCSEEEALSAHQKLEAVLAWNEVARELGPKVPVLVGKVML